MTAIMWRLISKPCAGRWAGSEATPFSRALGKPRPKWTRLPAEAAPDVMNAVSRLFAAAFVCGRRSSSSRTDPSSDSCETSCSSFHPFPSCLALTEEVGEPVSGLERAKGPPTQCRSRQRARVQVSWDHSFRCRPTINLRVYAKVREDHSRFRAGCPGSCSGSRNEKSKLNSGGGKPAMTTVGPVQMKASLMMSLMLMLRVPIARGVATQLGIPLHLMLAQKRRGREVILEMGVAQRALRLGDRRRHRLEPVGGDRPRREQPVELHLLFDQP